MDRAVALLHSFFYEEARRIFSSVAESDPDCAMAQWGIAMTLYHPIWSPPNEQEFSEGVAAVQKAKTLGAKTERERDYITAIDAYYSAPQDTGPQSPQAISCHGLVGDSRSRASAYLTAMEAVHAKNPKDEEATIFYALALLGATPPGDRTLEKPRKAAEILEKEFVAHKNHPGVAHYLIHAYDYPPTAKQGLPAAKIYASIAPWVPHALHMPSHIFTRLGMWKDSVQTNLASAEAARAYQAQYHPSATRMEELHALDYAVYAYLQMGEDGKAKECVDHISDVKATYPEADPTAAYALGAIPARYVLERHQWKDAAALEIPARKLWEAFPHAEGHLWFARAIGSVRSGDLARAKEAIARLQQIHDAIKEQRFQYFAKQVDLQRNAISAWIAYEEGDKENGLRSLGAAADLDDELGKSPVSPGSILPVRELFGDLLLEDKKPAEALTAYEGVLKTSPGRFNALMGAGRAAEALGDGATAKKYFGAVADLGRDKSASRPEIKEARAYLARSSAKPAR
jgi:tetratricopeptide (TPR) repeat protein